MSIQNKNFSSQEVDGIVFSLIQNGQFPNIPIFPFFNPKMQKIESSSHFAKGSKKRIELGLPFLPFLTYNVIRVRTQFAYFTIRYNNLCTNKCLRFGFFSRANGIET